MPLTYPCGYKAESFPIDPADPVTVVQEPMMTISYPDGCYGTADFTIDRMPTMNREPETIPNIPGGFPGTLEYADMGVVPSSLSGTPWVGRGAQQWDVYVDGIVLGDFSGLHFDGDVGPFTTGLSGANWSLPHTFWLKATYHDRPGYFDYYMSAGMGVVAYAPSELVCPSIGSIGWGDLDYWDPWVAAHHDVTDVLGPTDRHGDYLGLTGPWGADVGQQALASPGSCELCASVAVADGTAFGSTLTDLVSAVEYPEVVYDIESAHQMLPICVPTRAGTPVFRNRHKAEAL